MAANRPDMDSLVGARSGSDAEPLLRRAAAAVLTGLLTMLSLAPLVGTAGAAGCDGVSEHGEWTTIRAPRFSAGDAAVAAHGVDLSDSRRIYASNGTVVAVTTDGGCRWRETFTGEGLGGPAGSYEIRSILSPSAQRVVLTVTERIGGQPRPRIVLSEDGGRSWGLGGAGLPVAGEPEFIRTVDVDRSLLFLGIDVGGGSLDLLYMSPDGGTTWVLRSNIASARPNAGIEGVEVDPIAPEQMWAWGSGGLYRSDNGGSSFRPVDEFEGVRTGPVDLFHAVGGPPRLLVFTPEQREFQVSRDGGESWFKNATPSNVSGVAHGLTPEDVVITASGDAYRYHDPTYFFFDLEAPRRGLRAISSHRTPVVSYFAHTDRTIEKYNGVPPGSKGVSQILREKPEISLELTDEWRQEQSSFGPDDRHVRLDPGGEKTLRYRLDLPKTRLPVDVVFLMDTTDSMDSILNATAEAMARIINKLNRAGLDVHFGVTEHRAYPDSLPPRPRCSEGAPAAPRNPISTCEHNFVYQNVLPLIDPADDLSDIAETLRNLVPLGGGIYDAQLGAMHELATGSGQDVFPPGPSEHDVPAGKGVAFRAKTDRLRVVIHPTDEPFGTPDSGGDRDSAGQGSRTPPPDIPSFEKVIDAFNRKNIRYVGLALGEINKVRADQARVAKGTGALAPKGGTDCNGDGRVDLAAGEPLVCSFPRSMVDLSSNVADSVVGLVDSIVERTPVSLEVRRGEAVVSKVTPERYSGVLLQAANKLTFDVTYRCTRAQAGKTVPVILSPEVVLDDDLDLEATTKVTCKGSSKPEEGIPPGLGAAPLVALGIPPPPPPPPATQLSQAPQMQGQAQGQAQGAAAEQEEQQPQMAFVTAYSEQLDQELAFSSYQRRGELPAGATLAAGAVASGLMAATGVALARRRRVQRVR